jgi:hypothetical protein
MLALFLFLSTVTAFMPQCHELRYYLYWPLLLMTVVAALKSSARLSPAASAVIAGGYVVAFMAYQAALDFPVRVVPMITQQHRIRIETADPPVQAVRDRGAICLGPEHQPRQFAYAAVFHGGNYIVEQGWTRCVRYPAFNPPPR